MTEALTCPKCRDAMEQGFALEFTGGGPGVEHWAPGAPQKSFWTGLKIDQKRVFPIGTYRCRSCGFLEMYARQEFAPKDPQQ